MSCCCSYDCGDCGGNELSFQRASTPNFVQSSSIRLVALQSDLDMDGNVSRIIDKNAGRTQALAKESQHINVRFSQESPGPAPAPQCSPTATIAPSGPPYLAPAASSVSATSCPDRAFRPYTPLGSVSSMVTLVSLGGSATPPAIYMIPTFAHGSRGSPSKLAIRAVTVASPELSTYM